MSDRCDLCPHDAGDHVMAAPGPVPVGGVMFCPVKDCPCAASWSVPREARGRLIEVARGRLADEGDVLDDADEELLKVEWENVGRDTIEALAVKCKTQQLGYA